MLTNNCSKVECNGRLRWHSNSEISEKSEPKFMIIKLGSMQWKVTPTMVTPTENNATEYITIDVEFISDYKTSNLWAIDTEISIKVLELYGAQFQKQMNCYFDNCSTSFNFGNLMTERDLIINDYGLNWSALGLFVTAKIRIKSCIGIELPVKLTDFSIPKSIDSEIVLITDDGRRFFANRYVLECFSPFFRSNCKDCDELRIEIDDIAHFSDFLRLMYGEKQQMSDENVEGILKLTTEYEVEFIIQDIEEYLIITKEVTNENKLRMAELYKLPKLQDVASMKISIDEKLKEFTKEKVMNMNNETVRAVLSRMCI